MTAFRSSGGIEALLPGKFGGNHRNATAEEEVAFLEQFKAAAKNGQTISVLLVADGAAWHKSKDLEIPPNRELFPLPLYTPEMNPIEQI